MNDAPVPESRLARTRDLLMAVKDRLSDHNASLAAAAVAFFAFLALIPTLAGIIGAYGLVADPDDITEQLTDALEGAPETTRDFLVDQMSSIASGSGGALGVSVVVSVLIALFSASGAVANLIKALNGAYELDETRKPWTLRGLAFLLMLGGVVVLGLVVFLMSALPPLLAEIGLGTEARWAINIARFPVLGLVMAVTLSLLYRLGPDHRGNDRPLSPRLLTTGGVVATVLFVVLSALFSFYTANLGSYGETYGPLATIIVLLVWFQLSALSIVIGAEVDAELSEREWRTRTGLEDPEAAGGTAADAARALYEALDGGDTEAALARWHRTGVEVDPLAGELAVPEQWKEHADQWRASLPDLTYRIDRIDGAGDTATVRYRVAGSFTGDQWGPMPPNDREVDFDAVAVVRVEDGFVVRNDILYDSALVREQLGFRPGDTGVGDRLKGTFAVVKNRWRDRRAEGADTDQADENRAV